MEIYCTCSPAPSPYQKSIWNSHPSCVFSRKKYDSSFFPSTLTSKFRFMRENQPEKRERGYRNGVNGSRSIRSPATPSLEPIFNAAAHCALQTLSSNRAFKGKDFNSVWQFLMATDRQTGPSFVQVHETHGVTRAVRPSAMAVPEMLHDGLSRHKVKSRPGRLAQGT